MIPREAGPNSIKLFKREIIKLLALKELSYSTMCSTLSYCKVEKEKKKNTHYKVNYDKGKINKWYARR